MTRKGFRSLCCRVSGRGGPLCGCRGACQRICRAAGACWPHAHPSPAPPRRHPSISTSGGVGSCVDHRRATSADRTLQRRSTLLLLTLRRAGSQERTRNLVERAAVACLVHPRSEMRARLRCGPADRRGQCLGAGTGEPPGKGATAGWARSGRHHGAYPRAPP